MWELFGIGQMLGLDAVPGLEVALALLGIPQLITIGIVFFPLERLFALHRGRRLLRRHAGLDLLHALLSGLLIKLGIVAIMLATGALASLLVPSALQAWVEALPLWIQVPAAILISDLGFYWMHRTFHRVPWLWRIHSVHHSIEELDWLAGHRVHPLDQALTKGAGLIPLLALGFSESALLIFGAIYVWQSILLHSNVRLKLPPLARIIALPTFHHWHHANEPQAIDRNFAGQLAFLDVIFGTFYRPDDGRLPTAYGLDDPPNTNYLDHLLHPFRRRGQ